MRNPYFDPEPPVTPPEAGRRHVTICPVCHRPARTLYLDDRYDVFACDCCMRSDLVDDVLDIPAPEPIPACRWCGAREQTVYMSMSGEIRACARCVRTQETD